MSTDTAPSTEEDDKATTPTEAKEEVVVKETGANPPGDGYTQYKADNKENEDRDRPYYIRSKDIYNGSPKDGCRTEAGYSTLRKNTLTTNVITNCPPADV